MKIIRKIALAELQSLFFSPIAWLVIIVFAVQILSLFTGQMLGNMRTMEMGYPMGNLTMGIFAHPSFGFFARLSGYLYLYIPLLTMALMSRELSSGSIKLLYSSPVSNSQIILGKFFSMMVYGLLMIAIISIPVLYGGFAIENFDWPVALMGLLGVYLLMLTYSAIGLFMSSLTSYQIVAAIGTYIVLFVLESMGRVGQSIEFIRDITYWLNISGRATEFFMGLLSSEGLLYFILVSSLFLALTILRLKAIRQKARGWVVWSKYLAVVCAVFLLGYVTSRPAMKLYYDSTHTKQLTLTENSQRIIEQADGPMTITTYVNALDQYNMIDALPFSRNNDLRRFEQYTRFKPEIKVKYVYYYKMPEDPQVVESFARQFPDLSESQIVGKISTTYNIDSMMFKPLNTLPEDIQAKLAAEDFRFVRIMERGDGQETFLRVYNDMQKHPSEREITAAIKRVIMDLPTVGFVAGHGQRSIYVAGDRGYSQFSNDKPFRFSLLNQGFNTEEITLDQPVPEHINIIVLADMRQELTAAQEANMDAYIARGGNMIVAGELNRQQMMNPVVEKLGLRFLPGQVVRRKGAGLEARIAAGEAVAVPQDTTDTEADVNNTPRRSFNDGTLKSGQMMDFMGGKWGGDDYLADFVVGNLTEEADALAYGFGEMRMWDPRQVVSMPGALAIVAESDKGFKVTNVLMNDEQDSWNKLEPANFVDDTVRIDARIGEKEERLALGVALTREVNGREQRILVLGDSDGFSNAELNMRRNKVPAANYNMIMATFYWLSDSEVPIDIRRPSPTDNTLTITGKSLAVARFVMVWVFPALLLAASIVLWLRRKGR